MSNSTLNSSIVLYHNDKKQLTKTINSFLNTELKVKLFLVDNSKNDNLKELAKLDDRIIYIFNNANLGYGKAHNVAIQKSIEEKTPYHLVLNPDIYFEKGVLEELYNKMQSDKNIGNICQKFSIQMAKFNIFASFYQILWILFLGVFFLLKS